MRLEWGDFHHAPHTSIYSVEQCGVLIGCRRHGGATHPWMHRLCILGRWLLLQGGCEDSMWWSLDRKSVESSKCMTMGPWICHEQILSLDQIDLDGGFPLAEEEIPRISDVAGPQVEPGGALVGLDDASLWALGLLSCPLVWNVHICHHFGLFCHISCIQIILQAQVELGEI
jgi:hypothetical protein